jgi:hypothetical protein
VWIAAAGTIERRPDDLGTELARRPKGGDDTIPPGYRAREDPEAVVARRPAREAGRIGVMLETRIPLRCLHGVLRRDRLDRVQRAQVAMRFGNDKVAVPQLVPHQIEIHLEWRRVPEHHLEPAAQRLGEKPAGVAPVRRPRRPVEAGGDDHRRSVR